MKILNISFILWTTLTLSGCGAYQADFKCQAQEGLGCRSITEVNDLVNQGWPSRDALKKEKKNKCDFLSRLCQAKSAKTTPDGEASLEQFLSSSDSHCRIWIAPFQIKNQYWDEQFVYHSLNSEHPGKLYSSQAST